MISDLLYVKDKHVHNKKKSTEGNIYTFELLSSKERERKKKLTMGRSRIFSRT